MTAMQNQDSLSTQGFGSQGVHNPNLSISSVISTSCVILGDAQGPSFDLGVGCVQGAVAGAMATIPVLAKGCEVNRRNSVDINQYQCAEGNPFYPLSGSSGEYMGFDTSDQSSGYNSHLYEPATDTFNWTNPITNSTCTNGEGYAGLSPQEEVNSSKSNHSICDRDWAKYFYFEGKTSHRNSTDGGQGSNGYGVNAMAFFDSTCGFKHQEHGVDMPLFNENCSNFHMNTDSGYVSTKTSPLNQFNVPASGHVDHFQTDSCWLQKNSNTERSFVSEKWPNTPINVYPTSRKETFSVFHGVHNSGDGTSRDYYNDASSSCCGSNKTGENQSIIHVGESINHQLAMNATELVIGNFEQEPYEIQSATCGDTSQGQCYNAGSKTFPGHHKNNQVSNSGEENTLSVYNSDYSVCPGYSKSNSVRTDTNHFLNNETCDQLSGMDRKDKMIGSSFPKSSKSDKSSCVVQRSKKKKDTVEGLQRQLMVLEEHRKDTAPDVRLTSGENPPGGCDASKPDLQDRILVDVDHMICSGVTVAGFKPRATIRKRNKVATSSDEKDRGYWQKRRKNNDSARKSREAKKEKEKSFYKRALELEYENMYLQRCLRIAESEMAALGQTLVLPPLNNQGFF
ncbi:hepatic leukemia factor [Elysia marginata]|uniref:Hepatic leukemia factor n=1 Tax=Elysia marginata TaxID=1093978 RepID=A0AAV4IF17_9GAST|nr:hepatic leukemia factor [Elysia marginata]